MQKHSESNEVDIFGVATMQSHKIETNWTQVGLASFRWMELCNGTIVGEQNRCNRVGHN